MRPVAKIAERISARITIDANGCWVWQGDTVKGYGRICINGRKAMAHRASYEAFVGDIPCGLHVLHRCDNPPCCNPGHLFVGTRSDNIRDAIAKERKHPVKGSKSPNARLDESDVAAIRKRLEIGESKTAIASCYGVTRQAIGLIASGKNWKHV